MKRNFLRLCLMLGLLSLNSCRQDIFPEQETYHNTSAFQLTSKRISLNEAKHKAKLVPEIDKVETGMTGHSKNNVQAKTVNYGNGVSIDTDDVIYLEKEPDYYTYTFRINRENASANAPIENLVLSPLPDGTWKEVLVTYYLTPQERENMLSGIAVDLDGKVTRETLQNGTYSSAIVMQDVMTCHLEVSTYYTRCGESDDHHNGELTGTAGPCRSETPSVLVVSLVKKCTVALPVDTGLGEDGEGGGSGPQNGPGGLSNNPPEETTTAPNLPPKINQADCKKVKDQFAKEAYKNKVATINKSYNFNLKYETGFKENKDGNFVDLPPSGKNALTIPININTKGYTHVHNNDRGTGKYTPDNLEVINIKIRMFSPADVDALMEMADFNKSPENFADLYGTMLSSDGTYVIKFTGTADDIKTGFGTKTWRTTYEEFFLEKDKIDNETKFLLFMKNKMQVKGISLYKVKSDGKVYEYKLNTDQTKAEPFECGN
jgi:hypothetical protein